MCKAAQVPPQTEQACALRAHARGPFPTSIPTTTRTSGFARILRILPRLPLSPFPTSVDQNAEACPTHHSFSLFLMVMLLTDRWSLGCIIKRISHFSILS